MRSYVRGFTLIELLIVIAIIGILAVLVISAANRSRDKAYDRAVQSALGQLRWQAEIAYDNSGGTYQDWVVDEKIQEQVYILLDTIDENLSDPATNCGDYTSCPGDYQAILRYSQEQDYCISAPKRSSAGYFCLDHTGTVSESQSACPDYNENGDPLLCPA
ncbi:MAG: type II secretion system protein [Candidatus Andersenbacteria bacterium]